jgi:ureidoglycolate lyase
VKTLQTEPLTREAFRLFGDVIEIDGAQHYPINQGYAERYHDLAKVDCLNEGGEPIVSIFHGRPRPMPITIELMERHPLGSQAFYALQLRDWLVVVAEDARVPASYRAFRATGRQGVNYARNVWHHPLLVLEDDAQFLIIDRKGPGNNLEEILLDAPLLLNL